MKKLSQQELDRFGKKKGFAVRRKMGAQQKKPEPEVEDDVALSGAKAAEAEVPTPALPLEVNMEPFAAMSASMKASDANFAILIQKNTETIEAFRTQLAEKPEDLSKWQMADFIRHKVNRKNNLIDYVDSIPMMKST